MKKENLNLLLGLAAIGLAMLISNSKKQKIEEDIIESIGKIPPEYIKVGRINMTIARKAHIKAGDIVVHPHYIRHIELEHGEQLANLGITASDYIKVIIEKFSQIRKGSDNSILLVIKSFGKNKVLALQLTDLIDDKNQVWEIHTSYPRNKFNKNQKLLWER